MFSSSTSVYNVLSQSHINKAKKKKAKAKKRSNNDSDDDVFVKRPAKMLSKKCPVKAIHHVNFESFIMVIAGNEAARNMVSPHCIELIKKAVSCHEIEDPLSNVLKHLNPIPIINTPAVYAKWKDPDGSTEITKIGCTIAFRDRIIKWDKEKNTMLYFRLIDFDNVGIDFYLHCESIYELVMTEMTESKELSIFQRLLFRALHLDKGWKLGAKKSIMLVQMLE